MRRFTKRSHFLIIFLNKSIDIDQKMTFKSYQAKGDLKI